MTFMELFELALVACKVCFSVKIIFWVLLGGLGILVVRNVTAKCVMIALSIYGLVRVAVMIVMLVSLLNSPWIETMRELYFSIDVTNLLPVIGL